MATPGLEPGSGLTVYMPNGLSGLHRRRRLGELHTLFIRDDTTLSSDIELRDLAAVNSCVRLSCLIFQVVHLVDIHLGLIRPSLHGLRLLDLCECASLTSLAQLTHARNLERLYLEQTGIQSLHGLRCRNLLELRLKNCRQLTDVTALIECPNVHHLGLGWCTRLTRLAGLEGLTALKSLDAQYCLSLREGTAFENLTALTRADFVKTGLRSLHSLSRCVNMQWLDISRCS
jgi:Leucine-rich repeat (LRR) protein